MKKNEAIFHEFEWHINKSFHVYVHPGERIEVHTRDGAGNLQFVKVFRVGDVAEHDSYNLKYTGVIKSITAKNVIIEPRFGRGTKRLDFKHFSWRNHDFDVDRVARENWETSMNL